MNWAKDFITLYFEDPDEETLAHVGVGHDDNPPGRGSGRWEYGSGDRPFQRSFDLYSRYLKLRKSGMSETEIAKAFEYYKTDKKGNIILDENGEPMGNSSLLRARVQNIAKNDVRTYNYQMAKELSETIDPDTGKLYTNTKIAKMLPGNHGESYVRTLLKNDDAVSNSTEAIRAAEKLKELVGTHNYIDVGRGTENALGISPTKLKDALQILKDEGYSVQEVYQRQVGVQNGENMTITRTLCPPGATSKDAYEHRYEIMPVERENGVSSYTLLGIRDPVRVSMDRVKVRFDEEGGTEKDGVVEIRAIRDKDGNLVAASPDLSLGDAKYAQVRIAVEGDKYIKGMAIYNENLPEGTDILVNSNKSITVGELGALKDMKKIKGTDEVNSENPFGATVYQTEYEPGKLSAINMVGDIYGSDIHKEGSWGEWSRNLPSQFLGKQSETLIKQQLKLKVQQKQEEYEEILNLTNPVIKRQLLKEFADGCDSDAVDLKAAALPNQRVQVILPVNSLKETEIYAPNYEDGQTLALIRYPHTGPFEIPIVKVNNNNKEAQSFMKDAKDAVGINKKVADVLSGADFDGDTVTVIPMTRVNSQGEFEKTVNIKGLGNGATRLPGMEGFTTDLWKGTDENGNPLPGVTLMDSRTKGIEMGVVSNLITDMSLKGCNDPDELARAVKYSMVVIDAEKHKLDYKAAEKAYEINELKEKYQDNGDGRHGASTLLSRSKGEARVNKRRMGYDIDPETGEKIFQDVKDGPQPQKAYYQVTKSVRSRDPETGKLLKDENGKQIYEDVIEVKERQQKSTNMYEAKDARELLSDHPSNKEILYADYANKMKSMANESRKEYLSVGYELKDYKADPEAKKKYAAEVESLNTKLEIAKSNAPKERAAQRLADQTVKAQMAANPDLGNEEVRRLKAQALSGARARTGAQKSRVTFTDEEWEAIQHRAISKSRFEDLLKNADADSYKALALPRDSRLSDATIEKVKGYLSAGWTKQEMVNAGIASADVINAVMAGQNSV